MRWVELDGPDPARVYLHGLGASSGPYFTQVAGSSRLTRRRSLLVDFFGFGLSDRPESFRYSLTDHADSIAALLQSLGLQGACVVGHSMGGSVAIVLAHRHPDLVRSVVAVEADLDARLPAPGHMDSRGIAHFSERDFVSFGYQQFLSAVDDVWAATMRLADPVGLHRSAVELVQGTSPSVREMLRERAIPKIYIEGGDSEPVSGMADLIGAGVDRVVIPGAGHNVTLDQPDALARVLAAREASSVSTEPK
jgi:pimeloyl-ACP methyl ester carboxylesterase